MLRQVLIWLLPVVTGVVRDPVGKPVPGARVTLGTAQTTSNEQGEFTLVPAVEGSLPLEVRAEGFEGVSRTLEIRGREEYHVRVELPRLETLAYQVQVTGVAPRTAASSSTFRQEEFAFQIVESPAQALRAVPGLLTAQHAGGGKADQYLMRGFDADHGTDLALYFDGIPVNMVSHAHGQGYADLHFVIPETLQTIDVYKGPYFTEFGNLAPAGALQLRMRDSFDESFVRFQAGNFGTQRVVGGFSPKLRRAKGLIAVEGLLTDGPFQNPQNLHRANLITRWTLDEKLTLLFTAYSGKWNASGQIPQREVEAGRLDRFGSLDLSEGGISSRYNFGVAHQRARGNHLWKSQFYATRYDLDLFSDFTFFARDEEKGDGILQRDRRWMWGGRSQYGYQHRLLGRPALATAGFEWRQDHISNGLFYQAGRSAFGTERDDRIVERNAGFYVQEEVDLKPWMKAILGVRHDRFRFAVGGQDSYRAITGPKASLIFTPRPGWDLFLNYGRGFHSNDARTPVLAAADGYEVGARKKLGDRMEVSAAYWWLDLAGELAWLGDQGTTELKGPTRRHGPEVELKWRLARNLYWDANVNWTRAYGRGTGDRIPRAPTFLVGSGLGWRGPGKLAGNLRLRHVGAHALIEDDSARAEALTVADLGLRYPLRGGWSLLGSIENLFNADYKEAQAYFPSRLRPEAAPVWDNHFTPGNPFTFRIGVQYQFER
jgi:outer membrane receptor protein involved in Fe transport